NVIDVAPGTSTTTIVLKGHVIGPPGPFPHGNQERVRVAEFPSNSVVEQPVGSRVDFTLTVEDVPLGVSTFTYQVSRNGDFTNSTNFSTVVHFTGSRQVTINSTPVAVADSYPALKGQSVQGNVLNNDHDGDNGGGQNPPDPDGDGNVLTVQL